MTKLKFFNVTTTYIDQLDIGNGIYNSLQIGNESIRGHFVISAYNYLEHTLLLSSVYFFRNLVTVTFEQN